MEIQEDTQICLICDKTMTQNENLKTIKDKQISTFIKKSKARQENDWKKWEGKIMVYLFINIFLMLIKKFMYF